MIDKLFAAISTKNKQAVEMMEVFGEDYWYVKNMLLEISGMRAAFEIIAGHSYTDHLLEVMSIEQA